MINHSQNKTKTKKTRKKKQAKNCFHLLLFFDCSNWFYAFGTNCTNGSLHNNG